MEYIRKTIQSINFEGYQDIDGKIIIKPPLYNLDVTNLGPRNVSTSPDTAGSGDPYSSASNPLTEISDQTNPFVIHLSEVITENETEDQMAIRKTRTVVHGNISPGFQWAFPHEILPTAEWIDIPKLQQFGLREEPTIEVPWMPTDVVGLFSHAIAETVRANRGYRTYTVTIPMRPELKLGFPIYFPHKDMYGYIKSINVTYQVGGTATMTIICDSIRRRVLIPQQATTSTGSQYTRYTSSNNLVYKFAVSTNTSAVSTTPNPNQSPGNNLSFLSLYAQSAQGNTATGSQSQNTPADPVGKPVSVPITTALQSSTHDNILQTQRSKRIASSWTVQPDTTTASYIMTTDDAGLFNYARKVDNSYFVDIQKGTMPFTDQNGYEVLSPFPWGRWKNLRETIKQFTEDGYITQTTDVNGNPTSSQQDISVLNATESFLFAGLGTPTATNSPSSQLISALAQLQNQADTDTVIVLDYSGGQNSNDSQLLNSAQPDIQNQAAAMQLSDTTSTQQQLINVLVSGEVSPNPASRTTLQQISSPAAGTGATPTAAQTVAQPPTITPSTGGTQTQVDSDFDFQGP